MTCRDELRQKFLERLGNVIALKRQKANLSQEALGKEIGVSGSTITRYEKGQTEIPASILPVISDVCDFPMIDYIEDRKKITVESVLKDALNMKAPSRSYYMDTTLNSRSIVLEDTNSYTVSGYAAIAEYMAQECTEEERHYIERMGFLADEMLKTNTPQGFEYFKHLMKFTLWSFIDGKEDEEAKKRLKTYYRRCTGTAFPENLL